MSRFLYPASCPPDSVRACPRYHQQVTRASFHDCATRGGPLCYKGRRLEAALLTGTRTIVVSLLPPVTPLIRERIAREFDDRGPDACIVEVADDLRRNNPELLDMAAKCANSLGDYRRIMVGFGMFYRLLLAPA